MRRVADDGKLGRNAKAWAKAVRNQEAPGAIWQ